MIFLEAAHYGEARRRLAQDPIVIAMAQGLANVPQDQLTYDSGSPRGEFTAAANAEYKQRGGTDFAHIGCIAEALLILLAD